MRNKTVLLLIVIALGIAFYGCCLADEIEERNSSPSICFSESSYAIGKGKTLLLEVTISGATEDMVELSTEWISSKPEVATVKKGQVKGIKVGRCTVTCQKTYSNGAVIKAECNIAVNELVKRINAPKTISVGVSRTKKINDVSISPSSATVRKLLYTSSDPSVATVNSSGEVTGVSTGNCIVTIESTDGGTAITEIKVNIPTLYSDKSEYTISSKKGLTIQLQCLNTSIDNIDVKNNSSKLFTVQKTTYDFVNGVLKIELSPNKKGKGKIIITDKKNKEKLELKINVSEKADSSYPNEIDIYEKNAVVVDFGGMKLISKGDPEWGSYYDGSHYLQLNFIATNTSSSNLGISSDDVYVNGWKVSDYLIVSLKAGTRGTCELTIQDLEKIGIWSLSDIKEIKMNLHLYNADTYHTVSKNVTAIMTYNYYSAKKAASSDFDQNKYPSIPYKDLMRYPEQYTGNSYSFTGYVLQTQKEDDLYVYRVSTSGKSDNVVFVALRESSGMPRLIEDDKVSIAGTFLGLQSYIAVLGNEITIPLMIAEKIVMK